MISSIESSGDRVISTSYDKDFAKGIKSPTGVIITGSEFDLLVTSPLCKIDWKFYNFGKCIVKV